MDNVLSELVVATVKVNDYISAHHYSQAQIAQVFAFEQAWGSTALGFGGWGGSTITYAWTHVIRTYDGKYHIFFNGRFAYDVESANEKFKNDLAKQNMEPVDGALKYHSNYK